jgi:hypothetical protein
VLFYEKLKYVYISSKNKEEFLSFSLDQSKAEAEIKKKFQTTTTFSCYLEF